MIHTAYAAANTVANTAADDTQSTASLFQSIYQSFYFQITVLVLAALFLIFLVAVAYWVFRDIRNRTNNKLIWIVSVLAVLLFNIFGVIFYSLLRPQKTLQEKEMEYLEKKLLEEESGSDEKRTCKKCDRELQGGYAYCPNCGKEVNAHCPSCQIEIKKSWKHCAYCGEKVMNEKDEKSEKSEKKHKEEDEK